MPYTDHAQCAKENMVNKIMHKMHKTDLGRDGDRDGDHPEVRGRRGGYRPETDTMFDKIKDAMKDGRVHDAIKKGREAFDGGKAAWDKGTGKEWAQNQMKKHGSTSELDDPRMHQPT